MRIAHLTRSTPYSKLARRQSSWAAHRIYRAALADMEGEYYRLCWRDDTPRQASANGERMAA